MLKLDCAIQTYAWGKRGTNSCVAKFKQSQNKEFKIDENKSYAELWMGTHSNGPSMISGETEKTKLNEYINNEELPFLFKILSVNQALSIQAHPNKRLAEILHSNDPKNYPDSNHKPEMLIALTKFQALCGFRPCEEIKTHFDKIPELVKLCEEKFTGDDEDSLKKCFNSMMKRDEIFIREIFEEFLKNSKNYSIDSKLIELFNRLHTEYPFDIGCFSIFLLNYFELEPNEAIYLQANVPHAYLYGDGVECMACSDNVVRAGLTPKFKDFKTLVDMLDYKMSKVNLVEPIKQNEYIFEYKPLVDEFSVQRIEILSKEEEEEEEINFILPVMNKYSILIIIKTNNVLFDDGHHPIELTNGLVFFIDKNIQIQIKALDSAQSSYLLAFRAYVNNELN